MLLSDFSSKSNSSQHISIRVLPQLHFPMDSSTRFRFRDSVDGENTSEDSSLLSSSGSDDHDNESELESMSAKGIKRLCSELIELKEASDEDFHRTVYLNYPAFVRIFKEVGGFENEIMQLKQQVSNHRKLVKDLAEGFYLEILSEESVEFIVEEFRDVDQSPMSNLEGKTYATLETFDVLLMEQRLDEALTIIENEVGSLKRIQSQEGCIPHVLMPYYASISERKSRLANQFALLASHPRVSAPEFQKALSGLCRLGDSQQATLLLLQFYHARLENNIRQLQSSKIPFPGTYMRELVKSVFSSISQAARSFVALYGEKSPYTSEFIQWACEETETFILYFNKYVKTIPELSGGLAAALEALDYALSFCSILETQCLVLRPYLVKLMRPCMEEVLEMHVYHCKKIIRVVAATDAWILDQYLILDVLNDEATSHETEYCLFTNSGRKLITLLQTTLKECFPLIILQMETSILNGIMDIFSEYINILEKAIPNKAGVLERGGSVIILAETLEQQLSVLANSSMLVDLFSSTARSILKGTKQFGGEVIASHLLAPFEKELNNQIFIVQDSVAQLRASFCQQFIREIMSPEGVLKLRPEAYINDQCSDITHDSMPSVAFQVLFLELRKLEKVGKEVYGEGDWLLEDILRELMKSIFIWLSNNQDFWKAIETSTLQQCNGFWQFVLDMQFLVEIARFEGYFSDDMIDAALALISRMESAFLSAELDPYRNIVDDRRVTNAAADSILKLLEMRKKECLGAEEPKVFGEGSDRYDYGHGSDSVAEFTGSCEDYSEKDGINSFEISTPMEQVIQKLKQIAVAESSDHTNVASLHNEDLQSSTDSGLESETIEAVKLIYMQETKISEMPTSEASEITEGV